MEGVKSALVHEFLPISGKSLERKFARLVEGLKSPFVLRGSVGWLEIELKVRLMAMGSAPGPGETQKTLRKVGCHCAMELYCAISQRIKLFLTFLGC